MNWNELLISCLPFFIIIAIWVFIARRFVKTYKKNKTSFQDKHDEMSGLLREIRDELKELNKNNSDKEL